MKESGRDLVSRRQFTKTAVGAGSVAVAPMIVPSSVLGQGGAVSPSDQVVVGGIGLGGRGGGDLKALLGLKDARFVGICDVKNARREEVKSIVDRTYGNKDCAMYADQFELLARNDIDAVLIAAGDRWHALLSIFAAQHGKDVYCEKPGSATIAEAIALAEAFHRYGRLYQAGSQRHSLDSTILAIELARTGKLGKLQAVHAKVAGPPTWPPTPNKGWMAAEPEPDKQVLDWDRWLGPAPWRPYNSVYIGRGEGGWYNFWDLHGGGILEWGPHSVDLAQAAANADDTQAVEYEPEGKESGPVIIHCRYANGVRLVLRDTDWLPTVGGWARFEGGDAGWVEGGGGSIAMSDGLRSEYKAAVEKRTPDSQAAHLQNWLDSVKSRLQPRCNVDAASNCLITCHAAYVAWQLRRKLTWDPATKAFVNDDEANRMRARAMREPWHI